MKKIKVMLVFGTRPEAIKMCPLVNKLKEDTRFETIVCTTGQHRDMLDEVIKVFNVVPDYDLNIMKKDQTLIYISNKVLEGIDLKIKQIKPDIVLVHGDTSTALNASLASFYNQIPIGHVEAGLRTNNIYKPFPEEANRRLIASLSQLNFVPTIINKQNLLKENIDESKIFITGNTVIDALKSVINKDIIFSQDILNNIDYNNKKIILLTTHRRENLGSPMINIFKAVVKIINENENVEVVFPIHKKGEIRELAHMEFDKYKDKIHLIEPLEYVEFANLMKKVNLVMTDSGGIQEEAPVLKKPVVVLRDETERMEAIEANTVILAGTDEENVYNVVNNLLNDNKTYEEMANATNPYGDGFACERIIDIIYNYFENCKAT